MHAKWYWVGGLLALLVLVWAVTAAPGWATPSQNEPRQTVPTKTPTEEPPPPATQTPEPPPPGTQPPGPGNTDTPAPPPPGTTATPAPPTETSGPLATPLPVATVNFPAVIAGDFVNVRNGPGTEFDRIGGMSPNVWVEATGRNADSSWWQIVFELGPDGRGWVTAEFVTPNALALLLPVVGGTPTPTGTATALPPSPTATHTASPIPPSPQPTATAVTAPTEVTATPTPPVGLPIREGNAGSAVDWLVPIGALLVVIGVLLLQWQRNRGTR